MLDLQRAGGGLMLRYFVLIAILLAGYDVPVVGFLVLNETKYQIAKNGSLEVA
jgi:hypothetical protein